MSTSAQASQTDISKSNAGGCPFHGDVIDYPMPREYPLDPPPVLRVIRGEQPAKRVRLWNGSHAWLVTRYRDVKALLTHPDVSADSSKPGFPGQNPGMTFVRKQYRTILTMDPPEHTTFRRMLTAEFTLRRIEQMRPKIESIVNDLIDKMIDKPPPGDFVEEIAFPLPSLVICELLGVPYEDHDFFQSRAKRIASNLTSAEDAMQATRELCDEYIGNLIRRKDKDPQDDLLSRVIVNYLRPGHMTHHDLVSMARLLLVAGHETSANTMAVGLVTLFQNPDQLAELKSDPSLVAKAVEEILRYVDAAHSGRRRSALKDIEIGDEVIRAGEGIILHNPSANRDPEAFPDPDRFDIHRDARHHVAFGFGVHQCLGQPLARMELRTVYETLFRRIPTLELAVPFDSLRFKDEMFVYGVEKVPVRW